MIELKLVIETDFPIGTSESAERVLEVLTADPKWVPERFGRHEPLRDRFQENDPEAFIAAWRGAGAHGSRMASFLFGKRRVYQATAMWCSQGDQLNSVHFTFQAKHADEEYARECLDLGSRLFEALHGQYGHLCSREEYWSKNVTDAWIGPTGRPEGGRAHGTDRKRHLPGIYWANFFGPAYVAFFGVERLRSAPAFEVRRNSRFWVLLTAASPFTWESPETAQREMKLREHLGTDAFFLLEHPNRTTRAPTFARAER